MEDLTKKEMVENDKKFCKDIDDVIKVLKGKTLQEAKLVLKFVTKKIEDTAIVK